jgi:hypothetical protein
VIIPHSELNPDTLQGLIEEFVTRDGTDYGFEERSLQEKVAAIRRQLDSGEVVILFSELQQSCNIVPKASLK